MLCDIYIFPNSFQAVRVPIQQRAIFVHAIRAYIEPEKGKQAHDSFESRECLEPRNLQRTISSTRSSNQLIESVPTSRLFHDARQLLQAFFSCALCKFLLFKLSLRIGLAATNRFGLLPLAFFSDIYSTNTS